MKVSIIIPNFNGADLLSKNLPVVLSAHADEVIVIDDGSADDSKNVLKTFEDRMQVIYHSKNQGYAVSINDGIKCATGEIVVLLNTDVVPTADFLAPLISHFENPDVFAVTCHEPGLGYAKGSFINGFVHHEAAAEVDSAHISFYASGGSAAYSREKFIRLGMYDSLYHPFYWEDTDMSYRAWKRGWQVWWEPKSIVSHERSSTIKKYFKQNYRDYIIQRNELFFNWKNITDSQLRNEHQRALGKRLMQHPGYAKIMFGALKSWPAVHQRFAIEKAESIRTDQEIFALFS